MKKTIILLLAIWLLLLPACATHDTAPVTALSVFAMKGPTGMGLSMLIEDGHSDADNAPYRFTLADSADEALADLIAGKYDFACVPTNLAAVLAAKAPGTYRLAAVTTLGVLSILDRSGSVHTMADLAGKTVVATGEGLIPELTLTYLASQNGLRAGEDFTVEYYPTAAEAGTVLLSGRADIAMLPQPYATVVCQKDPAVHAALDLNDEWDRVSDGASMLMTACVLVNAKTADTRRDAADAFLRACEESVRTVNTASDEAANAVVAAGIVAAAPIAKKAIPASHLTFLTGEAMRKNLNGFFAVLFEIKPSLVGGAIPPEDFYYENAKSPS